MRRVSEEVAGTIGGIAGTIEEMSRIATSIASAIEQQRAATAEIGPQHPGGCSGNGRGDGTDRGGHQGHT